MTNYDEQIAYLHERRGLADLRVSDAEQGAKVARDERSRIEARIKELAEAKLAEQYRPAEPAVPDGGGVTVLVFAKRGGTDGGAGNFTYHYAAISANADRWTITQTPLAPRQHHAMDWGQLLTFIGVDNWNTIGVFTDTVPPTLANEPETVDALTIAHIGYAWRDADGDRFEYRDGEWQWRPEDESGWRRMADLAAEYMNEAQPYTRLEPVAPAVPDTVAALGDEHRGHIWVDQDGDRWECRDGRWQCEVSRTGRIATPTPSTCHAPYRRVDA